MTILRSRPYIRVTIMRLRGIHTSFFRLDGRSKTFEFVISRWTSISNVCLPENLARIDLNRWFDTWCTLRSMHASMCWNKYRDDIESFFWVQLDWLYRCNCDVDAFERNCKILQRNYLNEFLYSRPIIYYYTLRWLRWLCYRDKGM